MVNNFYLITSENGRLYWWGSMCPDDAHDLPSGARQQLPDLHTPTQVEALCNHFVHQLCLGESHVIALTSPDADWMKASGGGLFKREVYTCTHPVLLLEHSLEDPAFISPIVFLLICGRYFNI
jgi:alpha-tubulin suppressor-like RCC1 family protein